MKTIWIHLFTGGCLCLAAPAPGDPVALIRVDGAISPATAGYVIDRQTDPWGVKVTSVEVKDVALPETMKRAMARQAESERERRAKITNSEAEFQTAEKLVQAGGMIATQPIALRLRFLQTLREVANERNATTFVPLPLDLFRPFLARNGMGKDRPTPPPAG